LVDAGRADDGRANSIVSAARPAATTTSGERLRMARVVVIPCDIGYSFDWRRV
jgi:hypothetical protein